MLRREQKEEWSKRFCTLNGRTCYASSACPVWIHQVDHFWLAAAAASTADVATIMLHSGCHTSLRPHNPIVRPKHVRALAPCVSMLRIGRQRRRRMWAVKLAAVVGGGRFQVTALCQQKNVHPPRFWRMHIIYPVYAVFLVCVYCLRTIRLLVFVLRLFTDMAESQ